MSEFNAQECERLARVLAASTMKPETMEAKAAVQLRAACAEVERLRDLASQACDWLESHSDKQARMFHAGHIRSSLGGKP